MSEYTKLFERFNEVYQKIKQNNKVTNIANEMGYTTTRQLYNVLEGSSFISTKAVINLLNSFDINPNYLFKGEHPMFNDVNLEDQKIDLKAENEMLQKNNVHLKAENTKLINIASHIVANSKLKIL